MMNIKVLGSGCARCRSLEQATIDAAHELGIEPAIEKVEDYQKIMEYGVMRTPGLVINEEVVLTGQVPKVSQLKKILSDYLE
ncbi:MAG TPA: thioredoxin family protein [Bacteroidales bacterium]|nr:thioredoxin family protein [Bacteroidales bacterium]